MKSLNRRIITALGVGALSLFITACGSDSATNSDSSANTSSESKTFAGENVQEIAVKTDGQNVTLRPADDGVIKVSMDGDGKYSAEASGGVLTVDVAEYSDIINTKSETLYIDLPSDSYKKISLTTTAGEISGEKVHADELIITGDSGDVNITGFEGKQLTGKIVAGNVKLDDVNGSFVLENETGNIVMTHNGSIEGDSEISTQSGNIEVKFDSKPANLKVEASSESGKIETSLFNSKDISSKGAGNKLNAELGSGGPSLSIHSSSGKIILD